MNETDDEKPVKRQANTLIQTHCFGSTLPWRRSASVNSLLPLWEGKIDPLELFAGETPGDVDAMLAGN